MNKHIELVKKWLANPESVTQEELLANVDAAYKEHNAAFDVINAASNAVFEAYDAALAAYDDYVDVYADYHAACDAAYWLKRYEELTE